MQKCTFVVLLEIQLVETMRQSATGFYSSLSFYIYFPRNKFSITPANVTGSSAVAWTGFCVDIRSPSNRHVPLDTKLANFEFQDLQIGRLCEENDHEDGSRQHKKHVASLSEVTRLRYNGYFKIYIGNCDIEFHLKIS